MKLDYEAILCRYGYYAWFCHECGSELTPYNTKFVHWIGIDESEKIEHPYNACKYSRLVLNRPKRPRQTIEAPV